MHTLKLLNGCILMFYLYNGNCGVVKLICVLLFEKKRIKNKLHKSDLDLEFLALINRVDTLN